MHNSVAAVCPSLRNLQLDTLLPIIVRDGDATLKDSQRIGDGRIFLKTSATL